MKSKFGKVLCTAVSAAAVVGGIAYVVKNILNKEEDDMDLEDVTVDEDDDEQFEEIFSDENKDEREYVSINITDEQEVVEESEETEEVEKTEEEDTKSLEDSEQE